MNEEFYFGKNEKPGKLNKGLLGPFRINTIGKSTSYAFDSQVGVSG